MSIWILSVLLAGGSFAEAQNVLGQFYVTALPDTFPFVIANDAKLIVFSTIPNLKFKSNNAIIDIDESSEGIYKIRIPAGTHIITYMAKGYTDVIGKKFNVAPNRYVAVEVTVDVPPEYKGDILIGSTPGGATVILNTIPLSGTTPIRLYGQHAMRHDVRLVLEGKDKDDYLPLDTSIVIKKDQLNEYFFTLVRKTGFLRITTSPANASVYLDYVYKGRTPLSLAKMPTGTYAMRIEKDQHTTVRGSVTVDYQKTTSPKIIPLTTIAVDKWKRRRRLSVQLAEVLPGFGQLYSGQSRGLLYSGAFWGAGYLGYDLFTSFVSAHRNFTSAREDYSSATTLEVIELANATMVSERETMIEAQEAINLLLPVIGGVYVLQILDVLIFGGGKRPVTDVGEVSFDYRLEPLVAHEGNSLLFRLGINF